jgi:hypothetical protein
MKIRWGNLGGQLGIGYCLAGLALIFLGWNGAATYDRVQAQMPYLVSGGLGGLALVVVGAALLVVQSNRADRAALQASLAELRDALERLAGPGASDPALSSVAASGAASAEGESPGVVAGPSAYHRPDCRLVEGQSGLTAMTLVVARSRGLDPCRICAPA